MPVDASYPARRICAAGTKGDGLASGETSAMTATVLARRTALVLALAAAAGCGSTVDVSRLGTSANGGGNGTQSLSVPSNASGGVTSTVPGVATAPGAAGGASTAPGASVPGATGPGTTTTGQAGGTQKALVGPGITSTTIYVGVETADQAGAADKTIGAAGAAPSYSFRDTFTAVANYASSHGGFAGRKMQGLFFDYNLTSDTNSQDQAACAYWTQDHKVFAIPGSTDITRACAEKAGALSLIAGNAVGSTFARFPHFIDPISIRLDRLGPVTVNGLAKAGYFAGKLGFVTWDDNNYKYAFQHGYLPAFSAHHIKLWDQAFVAVPQTVNGVSDTSAAMSSIVTKFRSEGIDHVIIQDGHAGVFSGEGLTLEFMDQAESQRYFPRYGQNADNVPGSSDLPSDQQDKAVAILDADSKPSDDAGWHTNQARDKCFKIEADAGFPVKNEEDEGLAAQACDEVFFLQMVLNKLPATNLTSDAFVQGVAGLGRSFPAAFVYGTQFAPGLRDGSAAVRTAEYSAGCSCLTYKSAPYYP